MWWQKGRIGLDPFGYMAPFQDLEPLEPSTCPTQQKHRNWKVCALWEAKHAFSACHQGASGGFTSGTLISGTLISGTLMSGSGTLYCETWKSQARRKQKLVRYQIVSWHPQYPIGTYTPGSKRSHMSWHLACVSGSGQLVQDTCSTHVGIMQRETINYVCAFKLSICLFTYEAVRLSLSLSYKVILYLRITARPQITNKTSSVSPNNHHESTCQHKTSPNNHYVYIYI